MSEQYPGGYVTKSPVVPNGTTAPGLWNLSQQAGYQAAGTWPPVIVEDPYFDYVTMLLTGDGTNGAQNNTFLDSSSNAFSITRNGNTTQGSFSPYGSLWSNNFVRDGSGLGGLLTVTTGTALNLSSGDFTIESWVFPTADVSYAGIFSNSSGNTSVLLGIEAGTPYANSLKFRVSNGSAWQVNLTYNFPINQWYHVAATRNGNVYTLWVNGVAQASTTYSGTVGAPASTSVIGRYYTGTDDYYYEGYISNLRVVKGTAVYTATFTPPTLPLSAISGTSLLTCQSNRFIDNSSNALAITITRTPKVQRFSPFNPTSAYDTATIGGSGYFDGSGDYLSVANNTAFDMGSGDFTIEGWVYQTSSSGMQSICSKYEPSFQASWYIGTSGTNWDVYVYYSSSSNLTVYTGTAPALNQWNHFALERNGANVEFYVNGARLAQVGAQTMRTTTSAVAIGRTGSGYTDYFFGYIEDLRIRKGTATYSGTTYTVPTAPLTAVTNTSLLCNMTNAGIPDSAMMNDLETVGNAQVSTSVKKYGTGSIAIAATGDRLQTWQNNPNLVFGTGDFTVECWVYITSLATENGVFQISATPGGIYSSSLDNVSIYSTSTTSWDFTAANAYHSGGIAPTTNTWTHLALVRNSGVTKLYVNGVYDTTAGAVTDTQSYTGGYVCVGTEHATSTPLKGYVDDFRITKGYARYTTNFTPPTAAFPTF